MDNRIFNMRMWSFLQTYAQGGPQFIVSSEWLLQLLSRSCWITLLSWITLTKLLLQRHFRSIYSYSVTLVRTIESCSSDAKVWVVQNKLQLNDNKTKILLRGCAPGIDLPSSLREGQSDIPFSNAACNLSVIFDSQLALKKQVNKLRQLVYLRSGGSVNPTVYFETTKNLVFLVSRFGLVVRR